MNSKNDHKYDAARISRRLARATTLQEALDHLRIHTYIIGHQSISCLAAFLYGFLFGCAPAHAKAGHAELSAFNDWIHHYYDDHSTNGWYELIHRAADPEQSIEMFWRLWDEYRLGRQAEVID
jgi:hypothetical protein